MATFMAFSRDRHRHYFCGNLANGFPSILFGNHDNIVPHKAVMKRSVLFVV